MSYQTQIHTNFGSLEMQGLLSDHDQLLDSILPVVIGN